MKIIKLRDILKNEKFEIIDMEQSLEFSKKIHKWKESPKFFPVTYDSMLKKVSQLNFEQKDLREIQKDWANEWSDWYFWFDENGLYINIDGVPIIKSLGKVHDYYKYVDTFKSSSRNRHFEKDKMYRLSNLSYPEIISKEIEQWKTKVCSKLDFGKDDDKRFSKSYKKFLNEYFKEELTETFGIRDKNGVNTIGAKPKAYFDSELLKLQLNSRNELIEILRIEETEAILGKKGVLQLFGIENFETSNDEFDESFYKWHFTPKSRVEQMELIEANNDAFLSIKSKIKSDGVLKFTVKTQPLSMSTICSLSYKQEYAKVLALYITQNDVSKAGIYEDEYGWFRPLCQNTYYDFSNLLEWSSDREYREDVILYFSNSFSTQFFEYQQKDNEKFLMSIRSGYTCFTKNGKQKYAFCLGDVGSLSFAIDEKLFEESDEIKVTTFNSDCY